MKFASVNKSNSLNCHFYYANEVMAVCETAGQQLYLHVCCLVSMCVKFCTPTTCTSGARALKMPDMEKWDAIFSYANEEVCGF